LPLLHDNTSTNIVANASNKMPLMTKSHFFLILDHLHQSSCPPHCCPHCGQYQGYHESGMEETSTGSPLPSAFTARRGASGWI